MREYVGGYSDWLRQRGSVAVPKKRSSSSDGKQATAPDVPVRKPRKLSYKDKRELEQLPIQIEGLEAEVAALHELMGDASFYRRPAEEIASTHVQCPGEVAPGAWRKPRLLTHISGLRAHMAVDCTLSGWRSTTRTGIKW